MNGGLQAVGRTYRHVNRYREVAVVLAARGFGDVVHALRLDHYADVGLKGLLHKARVVPERSRAERVRLALQDLGPTFIKAGQYLSTRPDLLAPEYAAELSKLQDCVAPFPFEEARRIVEEDLGRPLAELFRHFERRPRAAASIAQVHEAVLPDGRPVVVKVERPGLKEAVGVDLEIMAHLAALAERHADIFGGHRPTRVVAEIARSLRREIDFSLEAAHAERFKRQFAGVPSAKAPEVFRALSSPRVLTLERLEGRKADDVAGLREDGIDPRRVAALVADHYLEMIYVHGFFHADPHPGNLLVAPGPVIGYVDFGIMGRLDRSTRESLAAIIRAIGARDEGALTSALLALADYETAPDARAFQEDVAELMDQYAYRPVREWRLGRMLEQLFETTGRHRVRVPAEMFLLLKTFSELETLTLRLDPDFDPVSAAAPYVRWALEQRLEPRRLLQEAAEAGRDALKLLASAPSDLRELMRQARAGKLLIEFEHRGLEPALSTLDRVSNRLAISVLLGALVIGSALLLHARLPPFWSGMSALGFGGFALSGLLAVWLIAAIARHGRL